MEPKARSSAPLSNMKVSSSVRSCFSVRPGRITVHIWANAAGAEGEVVGAVVEHEGLELGAELLLGEAGADHRAPMGARGVGDGLRVAHVRVLAGVVDHAHGACEQAKF